jgi:hypothetical protein
MGVASQTEAQPGPRARTHRDQPGDRDPPGTPAVTFTTPARWGRGAGTQGARDQGTQGHKDSALGLTRRA